MLWNKDKLFCDINPTCYAISTKKEILKRKLRDARSKDKFALKAQDDKLPVLIAEHSSHLIKRGKASTQSCSITRL